MFNLRVGIYGPVESHVVTFRKHYITSNIALIQAFMAVVW